MTGVEIEDRETTPLSLGYLEGPEQSSGGDAGEAERTGPVGNGVPTGLTSKLV